MTKEADSTYWFRHLIKWFILRQQQHIRWSSSDRSVRAVISSRSIIDFRLLHRHERRATRSIRSVVAVRLLSIIDYRAKFVAQRRNLLHSFIPFSRWFDWFWWSISGGVQRCERWWRDMTTMAHWDVARYSALQSGDFPTEVRFNDAQLVTDFVRFRCCRVD